MTIMFLQSFTIQEICEKLGGTIVGNTTQAITGPEEMQLANNTQITFIGAKKYAKQWETSNACTAVINDDMTYNLLPIRLS